MAMVPARGLHVEIDHPDAGVDTTFTPNASDITPRPQVNGRASIQITIPKHDRWQKLIDEYPNTHIPLRVWKDGDILPIDSLDDVEDKPDQTILIGSGARQLRRQVTREVDQETVPNVVRGLINDETDYAANVDDPPVETQTGVSLASWSTTADFQSRTRVGRTDPLRIENDQVSLRQSLWFRDSFDDYIGLGNRAFNTDLGSNYYDGDAYAMDGTEEWVEFEFTPTYDIPKSAMGLRSYGASEGSSVPVLEISIDGRTLGTWEPPNGSDPFWRPLVSDTGPLEPIALSADRHVLRYEVVEGSTEAWYFDAVAPYDTRFNYTFEGASAGEPESKPDAVDVLFDDVAAADAITGASVTTGSAVTELALSNDQADTFGVTATNASSASGDFSSPQYGPSVTLKITLGRGETLGSVDLSADLATMPLVVNKGLSGSIESLLTQLADRTNSFWEARRDDSGWSLEWTKAGQRTSNYDPALSDYNRSVLGSEVVSKAIVYGRSQQRRGERLTANHGTAVDLRYGEIHEGSQEIRDPETGKTYSRGVDYKINWTDGTVTTLSGGNMVDGEQYVVDYQYQTRGEYATDDAVPETTIETELPALTTEMTTKQAARLIVEELKEPLVEVTATAPPDEVTSSLIEEINPSDLPGGALDVRSVEPSPDRVTLSLGSRRSVDQFLADLDTQLSTVSQRT